MSTPNESIHVDHSRTFKTLDEILAFLGSQEPEPTSLEDDYASNAPCDFSGYCTGSNCPYFMKCAGA